jgi:hypothetical protein
MGGIADKPSLGLADPMFCVLTIAGNHTNAVYLIPERSPAGGPLGFVDFAARGRLPEALDFRSSIFHRGVRSWREERSVSSENDKWQADYFAHGDISNDSFPDFIYFVRIIATRFVGASGAREIG